MKILSGFKDFLLRGNVVELAVAVVIGSAFTSIVTAFTDKIINPLIAAIGANPDVKGLGFHLRKGVESTFIDFGAVITAAINFFIIAAVVYFVLIMPMNKIAELNAKRKGITEEEAAATEAELLAEIRDLLAERKDASDIDAAHGAATTPDPTVESPLDDSDTTDGDQPTGKHAK